MANPENLTQEARSKGGKISAERRRAKKQMAEELKLILALPVKKRVIANKATQLSISHYDNALS